MAEGSTRSGPVAKHGARGKVNLREREREVVGCGERGVVRCGRVVRCGEREVVRCGRVVRCGERGVVRCGERGW